MILIKYNWIDLVREYLSSDEVMSNILYNKLFGESNICEYCGSNKTFLDVKS